jgi:parallel beta-helix repeat protein
MGDEMTWLLSFLGLMTTLAVTRGGGQTSSTETTPDLAPVEKPEPADDLLGENEPDLLTTAVTSIPRPLPDASAVQELLGQADIFVATNGRDNGSGTIDDPFATIERAVAMAKPDDVILVRGGTYKGPVQISQGGEEGAPVKIMGFPGERPVIDGSGTPANTDLVLISDAHVHFEGFEVTGATRTGIAVWSTHDVTIADNIIHDTVRGGIWIGSDKLGESYGHVVEGNDVFNTGLENEAKVWDSGWPRGIAIDVSTDTIVRDNMVFKNYGEGIGGLSSSNIQYIDNIAYDNYSAQMYFDNTQDITATGNILFHTGDQDFFRNGKPGIGILIANEETQYEMSTTDILVRDNTFAGVKSVFYDGSYGWGGGISNSVLSPNKVLEADEVDEDWLAPGDLLF